MKWTPGPWKANAILKNRIVGDITTQAYDKIQINNYHCTVATVYRTADAHLITLAPRMASAIRSALPMIQQFADIYRINGKTNPNIDTLSRELAGILAELEGAL